MNDLLSIVKRKIVMEFAMTGLTIERLRELLHYNPATGIWTWLQDINIRVRAGMIAGTCEDGYIRIRIDNHKYLGHRLAWFYMTGTWPAKIDHKNTKRDDNRWSNLRVATHKQNCANSPGKKRSLPKGVYLTPRNKYQASIQIDGKPMYLGQFDTPEAASDAYFRAAVAAHGEFARR